MPAGANNGVSLTSSDFDSDVFWEHVQMGAADECWLWTGRRNNKGYGTTYSGVRQRIFPAHRAAYALTHGSTPAGLCVMHLCDNPPCVNPAHLSIGTQAENLADMRRKGRQRTLPGVFPQCEHGKARLKCEICCEVREGRRGKAFEQFFAHECAPRLPKTIDALVEMTDARRALVFARVCGCFGYAATSGSSVADELGITRERVRQLRNDVMLRIGVAPEIIKRIPRGIAYKQDAKAAEGAAA